RIVNILRRLDENQAVLHDLQARVFREPCFHEILGDARRDAVAARDRRRQLGEPRHRRARVHRIRAVGNNAPVLRRFAFTHLADETPRKLAGNRNSSGHWNLLHVEMMARPPGSHPITTDHGVSSASSGFVYAAMASPSTVEAYTLAPGSAPAANRIQK